MRLRDVFPASHEHDVVDCFLGDAVFTAKLRLANTARRMPSSDRYDQSFGKFSHSVLGALLPVLNGDGSPFESAPFCLSVITVLFVGPGEEMGDKRVGVSKTAGRIIAMVEDIQPIGNGADEPFVEEAVSVGPFDPIPDSAVAMLVSLRSSPDAAAARVGVVEFSQGGGEDLLGRQFARCAVALLATENSGAVSAFRENVAAAESADIDDDTIATHRDLLSLGVAPGAVCAAPGFSYGPIIS